MRLRGDPARDEREQRVERVHFRPTNRGEYRGQHRKASPVDLRLQ